MFSKNRKLLHIVPQYQGDKLLLCGLVSIKVNVIKNFT